MNSIDIMTDIVPTTSIVEYAKTAAACEITVDEIRWWKKSTPPVVRIRTEQGEYTIAAVHREQNIVIIDLGQAIEEDHA